MSASLVVIPVDQEGRGSGLPRSRPLFRNEPVIRRIISANRTSISDQDQRLSLLLSPAPAQRHITGDDEEKMP